MLESAPDSCSKQIGLVVGRANWKALALTKVEDDAATATSRMNDEMVNN